MFKQLPADTNRAQAASLSSRPPNVSMAARRPALEPRYFLVAVKVPFTMPPMSIFPVIVFFSIVPS